MSPKHLGLAIYLHNEFGSRKLIDCMHNMGYSIAYTELRHFITSAAESISSIQTNCSVGSYLPPEIQPITEGGQFIVASADNWDHNEIIVDGKQTTHAMTSILVQPQDSSILVAGRIKRVSSRSLDKEKVVRGDLTSILDYRKPVKRPEQQFSPSVSMDELLLSRLTRTGKCKKDRDNLQYLQEWSFSCTRCKLFAVMGTISRYFSRFSRI
ncbi:unnamed protein product [Mytilus coruscus]|uniref:Uncharacterized protein n=1 Tax=Mytilus coruscus TaxID=42192 RepID=A0A6J8A6F5_MYTCO|nr:unnamed protein product [Mytilus coruscus]